MGRGAATLYGAFEGAAERVFARHDFRVNPVHAALADVRSAVGMLEEIAADVVVVGSTIGEAAEKILMDAAAERATPCVVVLDTWTNYAARFARPGRSHTFPDKLLVMDGIAAVEAAADGVPRGVLEITGNPAFDAIVVGAPAQPGSRRPEVARWTLPKRVVYFSEPVRMFRGQGITGGMDERAAIRLILDAVGELPADARPEVVVRPHPVEVAANWLESEDAVAGRLRVDLQSSVAEAIESADIVFSISSTVLFEALLRGARIACLQDAAVERDVLVLTRHGVIPRLSTVEAVHLAFTQGPPEPDAHKLAPLITWCDGRAAARAADVITHLARKSRPDAA